MPTSRLSRSAVLFRRGLVLSLAVFMLASQSASAMTQAQKNVFSSGVNYFDTEVSQCSADGTTVTVNNTMPTDTTSQIEQTLVVGFSDDSAAAAANITAFVKNHPYIGGIFFHGSVDSQDFTSAFFDSLQKEAKVPLLITSDDEGGQITRFLSSEPSAGKMGQESTTAVQAVGAEVGKKLNAGGINTLLGPVLDTYYSTNTANSDNKWGPGASNSRSFGTTGGTDHGAANIGAKAGAFAQGVSGAGLGVVYKHFPGIGQLTSDTDSGTSGLGSAANPLSLAALKNDLAPYKALASKNNGAIMFSNVHVKEWNGGKLPVSESIDAINYVRSNAGIGFGGLIISDDLTVPLGDGASVSNADEVNRALAAGINMPLVTPSGDVDAFIKSIDTTVAKDPTAAAGVTTSLDKIAAYKSQVTGSSVVVGGSTNSQPVSAGNGGCCSSGSSNGTTVVSGKDNVATVMNYLQTQLGVGFTQAIGITANLQRESGPTIDPTAIGGPAHGIAQWQDGRWTSLQNFAQSQGKQWTDLGLQLDFLKKEATKNYAPILDTLKADTDAKAVAHDWLRIFEGASDPNADTKNSSNVDGLLTRFKGGAAAATTGAGPGAAAAASGGCSSSAGFTATANGKDSKIIECPSDTSIKCTRSVYYSQYDGPWASLPFDPNDSPNICGTVGQCGCGLTSLAMAIATLTNDPSVTPATLLPVWQQNGLATSGGTGWSIPGWSAVGKKYGLNISQLSAHSNPGMTDAEIQEIISAVMGGALVGVSGVGSNLPFTTGGHFILIRGYNPSTKEFLINDPNNNLSDLKTTSKPWSWDMLRQEAQSAWKISK